MDVKVCGAWKLIFRLIIKSCNYELSKVVWSQTINASNLKGC